MDDDLTRAEIERQMDELACLFAETHDPKVAAELWKLARRLAKLTLTEH